MKTTAFVAHPDCSLHDTGWKHPDHQGRLPALVRALERDMLALFEPVLQIEAEPALERDLLRVHTPAYLARVRRAVHAAAAVDDTPVSAASWAAALAAAGTGISGIEAVRSGEVRNAFCSARPPGRGVSADTAGGFGLFNNLAIGARYLQQVHGVHRILVVDWGTSPPAGTRAIFAADPAVQVLSWAGDVGLLDALLADSRPEWILVSADLGAAPRGVYDWTRVLRQSADQVCEGRLVSWLECGYDAAILGRCAVQHLRGLAGLPPA